MKARKKPIEVFAIKYDNNIILEEFLKLLRTNKKEPVRYDESEEQFTLSKNEARLLYRKAIGSSVRTIPTVVFGR